LATKLPDKGLLVLNGMTMWWLDLSSVFRIASASAGPVVFGWFSARLWIIGYLRGSSTLRVGTHGKGRCEAGWHIGSGTVSPPRRLSRA
jgi:hypothetical protein